MSFNKILGGLKKDDKKKQEEIQARMNSVVAEIGEVIGRRSITIFELRDIIDHLSKENIFQMVSIIKERDKQVAEKNKLIEGLEKELNEYKSNDWSKSKENRGQEDKK